MIEHIEISVREDKWEELRKLLEVEHEHGDGMNECAICDEPLINVAIREIKTLRAALAAQQQEWSVKKTHEPYSGPGLLYGLFCGTTVIVHSRDIKLLDIIAAFHNASLLNKAGSEEVATK